MSTVLIIEDEAAIRLLLQRTLAGQFDQVYSASNGHHGMAQFRRHAVDCVITDLFMPESDGLDVITEIRQRDRHIPIVAISGGGPDPTLAGPTLEIAERLGASRTLHKPFTPDQLRETLAPLVFEGAA